MHDNHQITRPIKLKISILIAIVLVFVTLFSVGSSFLFLWQDFQDLEKQQAVQNRDRIRNIFFNKLAALHQFTSDWSSSDNTYSYIQGMSAQTKFEQDNLRKSVFWNAGIDAILFMDMEGRPVWAKEFDPSTGNFKTVSEDILNFYAKFQPFSKSGKYGLFVDENRIFLTSTRPILDGDNLGPRRGFLTVMQRADDDFLSSFNTEFNTQMTMKVHPKNIPSLRHASKTEGWGQIVEDTHRISFFNIASLNNDDVIGFNIKTSREVTDKALLALAWNSAVILIGVGLIFLVLLYSLDVIVVGPLRRMARTILTIGHESDNAIRLDEFRKDEIGLISHEINKMQDRILELALNDHLTGLPNRRLFEDRMASALNRAKRETTQSALLFLDLDGFKEVNDTFGHQVGDELLVRVARRLKAITRARDSLARLGGDEFGLIMELGQDEDFKAIEAVCEKIVATLARPFLINEQEINISSSIGISVYPDHAENSVSIIRFADIAMYACKSDGSHMWCFYDPKMER